MPLGIGFEQEAGIVERHAFADAGDDVGERTALRRMHEDIVDGEKRQVMSTGERSTARKIGAHVAAIAGACREPDTAWRGIGEFGDKVADHPARPHP